MAGTPEIRGANNLAIQSGSSPPLVTSRTAIKTSSILEKSSRTAQIEELRLFSNTSPPEVPTNRFRPNLFNKRHSIIGNTHLTNVGQGNFSGAWDSLGSQTLVNQGPRTSTQPSLSRNAIRRRSLTSSTAANISTDSLISTNPLVERYEYDHQRYSSVTPFSFAEQSLEQAADLLQAAKKPANESRTLSPEQAVNLAGIHQKFEKLFPEIRRSINTLGEGKDKAAREKLVEKLNGVRDESSAEYTRIKESLKNETDIAKLQAKLREVTQHEKKMQLVASILEASLKLLNRFGHMIKDAADGR